MEYKSRSYRIDDEVHAAILTLPESLNQYLRRNLLFESPKKKSRKVLHAEALKASDPMGAERPEIEFGNLEVPSGGLVAVVGAAIPVQRPAMKPHNMHSGVRPIAGCGVCAEMVKGDSRR